MPVIQIVGAGPGAEDLITVRGMRALERADFVLYAGSLVNPEILSYCGKDCIIKDSSSMNLEEQVEIMCAYAKQGKNVVRLHTGDPSLFGAINEQIRLLKQYGIAIKIIPGVSSVFAAAAELGIELTAPQISQSVVLTRTAGRTPMPEKEKASDFAKTGATLVFFLSTGNIAELMQDLHVNGGLPLDTPAAVVYRATWEEQQILHGTLEDIAQKADNAGFGRQALIFVGKTLQGNDNAAASKLYAKDFSHGYRNFLPREQFHGNCVLYAFSKQGLAKAKEIMRGLPCTLYSVYEDEKALPIEQNKIQALVQSLWSEFDAHVFIGATGIAVRCIAPCLTGKSLDPAVVACTDTGNYVTSLVSGHIGGANRLARKIARITGGQACISTATDTHGLTGIDEIAMFEQARMLNPQAIKSVNSALLHNKELLFIGNKEIFDKYFANTAVRHAAENPDNLPCVYWDKTPQKYHKETELCIETKAFVLGIGCKKNTAPELLQKAFEQFLQEHSLTKAHIAKITSCTLKQKEEAILELARSLNVPLEFFTEEELDDVAVPNPSDSVEQKIGIKSVAEASCLLGAFRAKRLYAEKSRYENSVTFALARLPHAENTAQAVISVVGLGSGSHEHITPEAMDCIKTCDIIAGYAPYIDFIRTLIGNKPVIQNGMTGEMKRCEAAMQEAAKGKHVCMVCSGDPGILAMAGLILELRKNTAEFQNIDIRIHAGVTAANIAAASLGAPLQNGFCLISLSDLLVSKEEVLQNLLAAAKSALPISLYNPAGKKRRELLHKAIEIFIAERGKNTLCAYVKNAGRETETKWIGTLQELPFDEIDMSTLVIIGSERTQFDGKYLYEARGYMDKYGNKE